MHSHVVHFILVDCGCFQSLVRKTGRVLITDIETVNEEAVTHNQRAVDAHPSDVTQFILWRSSQVVRYVLQPACNFWCARSAAACPAKGPKPHQFYTQCVRRGHCDGYYTFKKFGVWVQVGTMLQNHSSANAWHMQHYLMVIC